MKTIGRPALAAAVCAMAISNLACSESFRYGNSSVDVCAKVTQQCAQQDTVQSMSPGDKVTIQKCANSGDKLYVVATMAGGGGSFCYVGNRKSHTNLDLKKFEFKNGNTTLALMPKNPYAGVKKSVWERTYFPQDPNDELVSYVSTEGEGGSIECRQK